VEKERPSTERVASEVDTSSRGLVVNKGVGSFDVADGGEDVGRGSLDEVEELLTVVLLRLDLEGGQGERLGKDGVGRNAHLKAVEHFAVPEEDVSILSDERLGCNALSSHVKNRGMEAEFDLLRRVGYYVLDNGVLSVGTWGGNKMRKSRKRVEERIKSTHLSP
jgi:hypothetical protein